MKGKAIESNGKRAGKVAFMNEPQHQIIKKLGRISAEATDLSMEMAEMPQVDSLIFFLISILKQNQY
jgi:hypothetical protein